MCGTRRVLSNHKRLTGLTEAQYAYERVVADAKDRHTRELGPILELRASGSPETERQLGNLLQGLIESLQAEIRLIRAALVKLDLQALRTLKPEQADATSAD